MHIKYLNLIRLQEWEINYSKYGTQYIIEQSDNLYEIASRFNTTVEELKKLNNLTSDLLHPGEIIVVDNIYNPENKDIYKKYIVKKNDTLYNIAYNYGMTSNEILEINNLIDDKIKVGETIFVYNNIPIFSDEHIYTVKKGDSLYSIAKEFNTSIESIKKLNNLTDDNLSVNMELVVITEHLKPDEANEVHIVLPGESMYSISQKKGVSVEELKRLNNLVTDTLSIGQQILVPKEKPNEERS